MQDTLSDQRGLVKGFLSKVDVKENTANCIMTLSLSFAPAE